MFERSSTMTRREFIEMISAGAAMLAIPEIVQGTTSSSRKPNVIFILPDDQGYGDLACHGNPVVKTPNLDQLHNESVRFTDFHVYPVCSPSRAQLMTGCYPGRVGVWRTVAGRSILNSGWSTMAEIFKDNGYVTGIFGKWHLGDNYPFRPQDRGFQEVLIHGGGGIGNTPDYWANDYFDDTYIHNGKPQAYQGFCTDVFFKEALSFVKTNQKKPFFCYLAPNAPHLPYVCPEKYKEMYRDQELGVKEFLGMITNLDENVGKLRFALQEMKLEQDTILIFMTDNGTAKGAKVWNAGMRGWKGQPYDGGHRVPFFFHWPNGGFNKGIDIPLLSSGCDLLPTLIDICGLKNSTQNNFDGKSLLPLLHGDIKNWKDRTLFIDNQQKSVVPQFAHFSSAILTQKWRLTGNKELYDIQTDPGQTKDLSKDYPEMILQLQDEYQRWFADVYKNTKEAETILGSEKENPTCLTSHDIFVQAAWNHDAVLAGLKTAGFWAVYVSQRGEYRFTLRRWPKEANAPITGSIDIPEGLRHLTYYTDLNMGDTYTYALQNEKGKALYSNYARLKIGPYDLDKIIPDGILTSEKAGSDYLLNEKGEITGINFILDLEKGSTRLETWMVDDRWGGNSQGFYYVYVERLKG
jgi:arylsulfatase A-like enzyme